MSTTLEQNYIEEKIEELQDNVKFLINNYDYHHKNNEDIILGEEMEKLRQAGKTFSRLIARVKKMRKLIAEGKKMCNNADETLKELNVINEDENNENDNENLYIETTVSKFGG